MQTRKVIRFSLTGALMLNFISAFVFNQTLMANESFQEMADRAPAVEVSNELNRGDIAVDPGIQQDLSGGLKLGQNEDQVVSAQAATVQVNAENLSTKDDEKSAVKKEEVINQDHFQIRADSR